MGVKPIITQANGTLITQNSNVLVATLLDYHIYVTTIPQNVGSIAGVDVVTRGDSITLRARNEGEYTFSHWSTGETTNTLTISDVTSDLYLIAYYVKNERKAITYRAYVKDRLALNTLPKAFFVVKSFTIRRDLLTSSNSDFDVEIMQTNVNEGDIFVMYEDTGKILFYGVINSIEDTNIQCSQIQSMFKNNVWSRNFPTTSLEAELAFLLYAYNRGQVWEGNTLVYEDSLLVKENETIVIKTQGTTSMQLPTYEEHQVIDYEEEMYNMYTNYGIVYDFYIPFGEWTINDQNGGSVTIRKANSNTIIIGDNAECVRDMTPTTEIEECNKLLIYAEDGTYRTNYVYTTTNGIVENPSSYAGRLTQVNTTIVFSDDDKEVIRDANINANMFNHKVEFTLLLNNNLYDFWSWELGQPMQIWKGTNEFDSVFTGYEITKEENQEPSEVKIICGKVRTKLTSLLKKGIAR